MIQPHTLTITGHGDDREYDLTCPGPDIHCQSYQACQHPDCADLAPADYLAQQNPAGFATVHGVAHIEIEVATEDDYVWGAGTGDCYLAEAWNFAGAADDLAENHQLAVGNHLVDPYLSDDGIEFMLPEATR